MDRMDDLNSTNTTLSDELDRAEGYLMQGEDEAAHDLLAHLAEDVEQYVDANCPTTDDVQYFAFPTMFERLAYRRVEDDPRELVRVGEPFGRVYADLALACVRLEDYEAAIEALKMAVRWNPMDCASRLNLAELFLHTGDAQEYLALTYSVFDRASRAEDLARAFLNFSGYFEANGQQRETAAALRAARRLGVDDTSLAAAFDQAAGTDHDPDSVTDDECQELLAAQGLPDGANAEIAICLLMCATDAAAAGNRAAATNLTIRARDLVGDAACKALLQLIHETDAEDAASAATGATDTPAATDGEAQDA